MAFNQLSAGGLPDNSNQVFIGTFDGVTVTASLAAQGPAGFNPLTAGGLPDQLFIGTFDGVTVTASLADQGSASLCHHFQAFQKLVKLNEHLSNNSLFSQASDTKDCSIVRPEAKNFKPRWDLFDAQDVSILHVSLHVSLLGAQKEKFDIPWDADKFELSVGDTEILNTLVLDGREIGTFECKVVLGTKPNTAEIDTAGISAKRKDGVLNVTIPQMEQEFVEVKKIEIE